MRPLLLVGIILSTLFLLPVGYGVYVNLNALSQEQQATALIKEGKRAEAKALLQQAIKVMPALNDMYETAGRAADESGNYSESAVNFGKLVLLKPSAYNYEYLASAEHGLKKYREAASDYSAACQYLPDDYSSASDLSRLMKNRAIECEWLENYGEAIKDLTSALDLNPYSKQLYEYRADAYEHEKNAAAAKEDRAYAQNISARKINDELTTVQQKLQAGMNEQVIDKVSPVIERYPQCALAYALRGLAHLRLDDNKAAITDFSRSLSLNSRTRQLDYLYRGQAYCNDEQYDKGIDDLSASIARNPDNEVAYQWRAEAYANQEKFQEQLADINKVIELAPDDIQSYLARADFYKDRKKYTDSLADLDRAWKKINPPSLFLPPGNDFDREQILNEKAEVYLAMKKPREALGELDKAHAKGASTPYDCQKRAEAYELMGDAAKAKEYRDKAEVLAKNQGKEGATTGDAFDMARKFMNKKKAEESE